MQAFNELIRESVDQEQEKRNFIASLSHQLPTPIARIRLQLNALRQRLEPLADNKEALEILDNVRMDNELSVKLANDILELTVRKLILK